MNPIKIGLIGGTGLGEALGAQTSGQRHEIDTPFGKPSDAIIETEWAGVPVLILSRHGPGHVLNPSQVPFQANIFALKQLGCTHIIASGAVGSLREQIRPRDLTIVDQVIDKTCKRANTFYEKAAVHVEFAEPFCPVLRQILLEAGKEVSSGQSAVSGGHSEQTNIEHRTSNTEHPTENPKPEARNPKPEPYKVHDGGCYVCMEGPAFSSRAESLMHRLWGGDLIGMTAMPEAKLAKEAEISYALVALVTDYDCWRPHPAPQGQTGQIAPAPTIDPTALLAEILGNLQAATSNAIALIKRAVELAATRQEQLAQAPAQQALRLAIWSDKAKISPEEVQRLGPLWMKYFETMAPG